MASTTKAINNPTYLGSMIAGQQYQANQGLPNEYDVDAELFGNIKKQFGGDGKPRGVDALISGLATGAEYGSKMKGIGLRKEELAKYNKVMDYFMAANMEAEKANKKNMEMEEKRQSLMPYGLAGMELSYSGMPYDTVNNKMRNLFEQAQLNDPNIKGKYIGFIPNSPLLNVRDENGKDSVFSLAKIVGEDGVKRIQGDWVERQKLDAQQQGLQLQERGVKVNEDYLNLEKNKVNAQSTENSYGSIPISNLGGKGITPFTNAIKSEQNLSSEIPQVFKQLADAKKIINDNPNIGSGWANLVGSNSITRSALGDKDRAAYEKLDKISNRVAEAFIRAKGGNISDSERETIKKGLFDVSQSAESKLYNIQSVEDELSKAYLRGQFAGEELRKGLIYTPQGFEKSLEENPQALENVRRKFNLDSSDQNMVTVINPQGITGKMPKDNLQKALESGYKVIQ